MSLEMLELPHDVTGLALNLESDNVGAVLFGDWEKIVEGDTVKRTGHLLEIPVGDALLGRIVDPLGSPLDGKGDDQHRPRPARPSSRPPASSSASRSREPMQTGLKAIDAMIPIGRGQRELIIGDRQTGKTAIAIDTIINNKDTDLVCVYVAIGQRMATVVAARRDARGERRARQHDHRRRARRRGRADQVHGAVRRLRDGRVLPLQGRARRSASTTTSPSTPTPTARCRCCCAARRAARPTRATSSTCTRRLLERAVKLNDDLGGGSLTALPIIETQAGDVSAYIPTNVISITDGQIFLEPKLFYSGVRPAINVGISVSRVGGNAQIKPMKKVAGRLKLELSQYRDLEAFAQFGSDLDADTQRTLARGERLVATLNQGERSPLPVEEQVASDLRRHDGFLDRIKVERVPEFLDGLTQRVRAEAAPTCSSRSTGGDWSDETAGRAAEAPSPSSPTTSATTSTRRASRSSEAGVGETSRAAEGLRTTEAPAEDVDEEEAAATA